MSKAPALAEVQEPSIDRLLEIHPNSLTTDDLRAIIKTEREARLLWVTKQKKKGKEE